MVKMIVNGIKVNQNDSISINPMDRGFTLGHGIFETMYFENEKLPFLLYHFERLISSLKLVGILTPFSVDELSAMIFSLIEDNQLTHKRGGVKIIVTDGVSERGLLSSGLQSPTYTISVFGMPEASNKSIACTIVPYRKNEYSLTTQIKSISYLENIIGKMHANQNGFDEPIFLNTKGFVAECAIYNLFIQLDDVILTPKCSDGVLPGVFRHILLNIENPYCAIKEETISIDMLYDADEVFVTNALRGIQSVNKIDKKEYKTTGLITNLTQLVNKKFDINI